MRNVCLLSSTTVIVIPKNSLLYLHSNDMISLKKLFLKKKLLVKVITNHKVQSVKSSYYIGVHDKGLVVVAMGTILFTFYFQACKLQPVQ